MEKLHLVEDDPTLIRILTGFLATENFQVAFVTGQSNAFESMDTDRPDLALVDISLAEGNGFAVCSKAKALGIPVIFLTASGDGFSVVTGLDMGADDYISKPFRPRKLVSRIRSVLRRAGKRRSVANLPVGVLFVVNGSIESKIRIVKIRIAGSINKRWCRVVRFS